MEAVRALVTGANGLIGQTLVGALKAEGHEVIGVTRRTDISEALQLQLDQHIVCDLANDPSPLARHKLAGVDWVINLAANAENRADVDDRQEVIRSNAAIFGNLCEVLATNGNPKRVINVSSFVVYNAAQAMPLREGSRLVKPGESTAYADSKRVTERIGRIYGSMGKPITTLRFSNNSGAGQEGAFLLPDWAKKLRALQPGEEPDISRLVGIHRDIMHVKDAAAAIIAILGVPRSELSRHIYNVCSGIATPIYDVVAAAAPHYGRALPELPDNPLTSVIYGDNTALRKDTGWKQQYTIQQMADDFATWDLARAA